MQGYYDQRQNGAAYQNWNQNAGAPYAGSAYPQQNVDFTAQTMRYTPVQPQNAYQQPYPQQYDDFTGHTMQYAPVQPQGYQNPYPQQYDDFTGHTMQYAPVQPQGYQNPYPQQYDDFTGQTMQYAPVQPQGYQNPYPQQNVDFSGQTMQYAPVQPQAYRDPYQQNPAYAQQAYPQEPIQPNIFNQPTKPKQRKKKKDPHQRNPRSSSSPFAKVLIFLLIAGLAGGGAWLFFGKGGGSKASTAVVEVGATGTSYRGDALIVRDEVAYDEEGVQNIEYIAEEGSIVYLQTPICAVYSTGYSISEMRTLQDFRNQITDFEQTLLSGETSFDQRMEQYESEVVSHGLEVRSLVQGSRGNMVQQEQLLDTAIIQRQNYFRSKYSEEPRLNGLFDDESTQNQRIESWIKQKVSNQRNCIVSFYTDGFEYALNADTYESYTPTQVRNMINGQKPAEELSARGRTTLYRLVQPQNYVVLLLVKDSTWAPKDGETYKLTLEQFSNTVVNAKVLSSTRTGGELLVRLAVMGDVSDVLYMRTCSAELSKHVDCLTVPSRALYSQNGNTGIVSTTEEGQFFIPVKVLSQEGGVAYITAVQNGQITPGMTVLLFD